MFKVAFSTVACPEWTFEQLGERAESFGYDGVELRTIDDGSAPIAADPALTDGEKILRTLGEFGVSVAGVASGARFDLPTRPPLPGLPPILALAFGDEDVSVREAKRATALARALRAPIMRVFGFERPGTERLVTTRRRVVDRLAKVCDDARHSGARVALENGGDFSTAADVRSIIADVGSPLLGCCYSLGPGLAAGESPMEAIDGLMTGDDLLMVRLRDLREGSLCPIGDGELPCRETVEHLARRGYKGWVTVEWDRLWFPALASAESVLPEAVKRVYAWAGAAAPARGGGRRAVATV